ncbi:MAG: hypothetical protein O3C40_23810 [Planctomycetota bacterium]|nr:hypothetical protein [Planctomycetota bacterium]
MPTVECLVEMLFCLIDQLGDIRGDFGFRMELYSVCSLVGVQLRPTQELSRPEQQGFGAELEAGGNRPGVAALFVVGGEQFHLAGFLVGGDAGVESNFNVVQRSPRVTSQQVQPSPFEQQVNTLASTREQ